MGTLLRDIVYASQLLLKHPVVALALDIGANSTIFSSVSCLRDARLR